MPPTWLLAQVRQTTCEWCSRCLARLILLHHSMRGWAQAIISDVCPELKELTLRGCGVNYATCSTHSCLQVDSVLVSCQANDGWSFLVGRCVHRSAMLEPMLDCTCLICLGIVMAFVSPLLPGVGEAFPARQSSRLPLLQRYLQPSEMPQLPSRSLFATTRCALLLLLLLGALPWEQRLPPSVHGTGRQDFDEWQSPQGIDPSPTLVTTQIP